jgi:predicted porin
MNKFKAIFVLALVLISMSAISAPKVYGKLNISVNNDSSDTTSNTDNSSDIDLISNASRLGFKGQVDMKNGLTGIYQIEYEVDITNDKTKGNDNNGVAFNQRNSFVGLKGNFGTFKLGTHDTPLKLAQLKADLFNDLKGDIKNTTDGENRIGSFFGYDSPVFGGGVSISLSLGKGKDDGINTDLDGEFGNNISVSLKYDIDVIKFVIATENNSIKGYDHNRLGMMIPAGPVTIGLIHTTTESSIGNTVDYDATTVSIAGKVADGKGKIKFQYGTSDKSPGLTQTQIGYDHKLFKKFKIFTYVTRRSQDAAGEDDSHVGLGIEYKF